jgi:hypothetical protein
MRIAAAVLAAAIIVLLAGTGSAYGDPKKGIELVAQCGSATYTVISPTPQAAGGQDTQSTAVLVIPQSIFRAGKFPEHLLTECVITVDGNVFDGPFLITGR